MKVLYLPRMYYKQRVYSSRDDGTLFIISNTSSSLTMRLEYRLLPVLDIIHESTHPPRVQTPKKVQAHRCYKGGNRPGKRVPE